MKLLRLLACALSVWALADVPAALAAACAPQACCGRACEAPAKEPKRCCVVPPAKAVAAAPSVRPLSAAVAAAPVLERAESALALADSFASRPGRLPLRGLFDRGPPAA